jgi:ABC-type phosphate transport system substrate-binding protein
MKSIAEFFIVVSVMLCFTACDREGAIDKNIVAGNEGSLKQISIYCDSDLQNIVSAWIEDFNRSHSMIRVNSSDSDADLILGSENKMVNINDTGLWRVPVMREGIIPVVSVKNPYLYILEQQGLSKENLVRIFTGEQISWGEVLGTDAKEPVMVYLPESGRGCNKRWADFLEVKRESLQGERYADKDKLLQAIKRNPFTIAILNACCAYHPETNNQVDGITALSIDLNSNGQLDKKEKISKDLCELERALYLGLYPSKLCNCIFLQADEAPATEEQLIFVKWILTQGQHHVADHGYSTLRHSAALKIIHELDARAL